MMLARGVRVCARSTSSNRVHTNEPSGPLFRGLPRIRTQRAATLFAQKLIQGEVKARL